MRTRCRLYRRLGWALLWLLLVPITLLLAAGISPSLITTASAAAAASCAGPVAGQHIYDCAGILSPSEIAYLETQATAVDSAGAPTVVYLQVRAATAQETLQDAIDLMNRWNVESRPGAHDGLVMVFNVQPGNLQHGEVALYSGAKYFQNGTLPQSELDRIQVEVMTPLLQQGQTANATVAGLQAVVRRSEAVAQPVDTSKNLSTWALPPLGNGLAALTYPDGAGSTAGRAGASSTQGSIWLSQART
jgi:uncharacterized membrane protein YgcG